MRRNQLVLGSVALALGATFACIYSPNPEEGALHCSPQGTCPKGYVCRVDGNESTCWKPGSAADGGSTGTAGTGAAGTGAAGTGAAGTGAAGTGAAGITGAAGTTPPVPSPLNFPGHWLFQMGSTQRINCSDGSSKTTSLATDYVDVVRVSVTGFRANYYCDWNLTLSAPPTQTVIAPGQSCPTMSTSPDGMTSKFTWKGTKFELKTLDGVNGTLQAEIAADYTSTTAMGVMSSGTCTVTISGTLKNAGPP